MEKLFREELVQARQEGRDPAVLDDLAQQAARAGDDEAQLARLFEISLATPIVSDFPFDEPNDLESIRQRRVGNPKLPRVDMSAEALYERMYGAWLGRCAGCALGKPVEVFMSPKNGLSSRQRLREYLTAIDSGEWPIRDYIPEHSPAVERTGRAGCRASTREHIAFMETDDDIRYTVLGQIILQRDGRDFTTRHVAAAWIGHLPYGYVCTAETQAYRNLAYRYGLSVRQEGTVMDFDWVATHQNPYREWIGAQIRADQWGYGAPGDPELAAEFAWRDARLSHVKNGIYGEMFVAAMIAAAFATEDARKIIEAGLAQIPSTSRLHAEMLQTVEICRAHGCDPAKFEAVLDDIEKLLGHYNPVHTNNNAALVVAGLLLGGMDLEKSITIAVMGGWDTDCNGATVGSIVGAAVGAGRLPERWIGPLNDQLYSAILEYHPIPISEVARRSAKIARRIAGVDAS
ncbi:MAG: ADP-ribosylglycohydrolase family protein [Phycisphaeraceae bacterium]|nr:ADP-ribosylglycohydrolase family protein [Phycisphaeraceae bacterium]